MKKKLTPHDLKSGYIVKLRNGNFYMVMRFNQNDFTKVLVNKTSALQLIYEFSQYDLKPTHPFESTDIMEVYGLNNNPYEALEISPENRPLLWKRIEEVEMTMEEVCKVLGKKVKIVEKH